MNEFNENDFYRSYKSIRNHLRKYNSDELIGFCIGYLAQKKENYIDYLKLHPWLVLLLLKWIILDELNFKRKQRLTDEKFHTIMGMMYDLGAKARLPSNTQHGTVFLRLIAYQQFIYQGDFKFHSLARQHLYFYDLPENNIIKSNFLREAKISISCFLDLAIVLISKFKADNKMEIDVEYFSGVSSAYARQDINSFLNLFAIQNYEVREIISKLNNGKRSSEEYYEQTYMLGFPLLRKGDKYFCVDKHVLWRCVENFVYDFMRRWNPQKFMNEFGLIFERGIGKSIETAGVIYYDEDQIKSFMDAGKCVDFLIVEDDANIFIEAKSVEMAYQGKVAHLTSIIEEKSLTIIKAINQGFDLAHKLSLNTKSESPVIEKSNNYLIIVTYKDFFLGSGTVFYEGIAKGAIDEIIQSYGKSVIPTDNIYFLNVDEFDLLLELVRSGQGKLVDILEKAKIDDSNPLTRKFNFSLHLSSFGAALVSPLYLREIWNDRIDVFSKTFDL